jgi:hypothetical protein
VKRSIEMMALPAPEVGRPRREVEDGGGFGRGVDVDPLRGAPRWRQRRRRVGVELLLGDEPGEEAAQGVDLGVPGGRSQPPLGLGGQEVVQVPHPHVGERAVGSLIGPPRQEAGDVVAAVRHRARRPVADAAQVLGEAVEHRLVRSGVGHGGPLEGRLGGSCGLRRSRRYRTGRTRSQ